ncbi:MAG: hypothetical protein OXC99_11465 [Chloroflexi bacterium]|nr:hypothetical protein [Chloroflexota bacterium]
MLATIIQTNIAGPSGNQPPAAMTGMMATAITWTPPDQSPLL